MTPAEYRARVEIAARTSLPAVLEDVARESATLIGARIVGAYFDAPTFSGPGSIGPRTDPAGPLRIVSGRLARATRPRGRGNVARVEKLAGGRRVGLSYGVRLDVVPYARIHELGGFAGRGRRTYIRARSYLNPAARDVLPRIRQNAGRAASRRVAVTLRTGAP